MVAAGLMNAQVYTLQQAIVTEQRRRRRPAPSEELEDLGGGLGAAQTHDRASVAPAERLDALLVREVTLLEGGETVGRENLGPLVRVRVRVRVS
jgi:hypothetical protein